MSPSVIKATTSKSPFTIENIPYGVISTDTNPNQRCATAFEDSAIDLEMLEKCEIFEGISGFEQNVFSQDSLNVFAGLPRPSQVEARKRIIHFLKDPSSEFTCECFIPLSEVTNHFPMRTSNFSDFYCSLEHTMNCTEIMLNITKVNQNWLTQPLVYNGRTSSLIISGTPIIRPYGIISDPDRASHSQPVFQPTSALDFELEMGIFLSKPVLRGQRLDIADAKDHIFGFVLLNDWSSRDIQAFEMQPLGPFHSKGSGTTISPWIVTMEALVEAEGPRFMEQEPKPLEHLAWKGKKSKATFDIEVSVGIVRDGEKHHVATSNINELHWTPLQQLTHLSGAGEGLSTGDIFGTGTLSSSRTDANGQKTGLGCLLERKLPRNRLAALPDIADTFLLDGDEVIMEGWCVSQKTGVPFGFGQCSGVVMPVA